jgi:hypothetical protein
MADRRARTQDADRVTKSICPFRAVACGQQVFTENGKIVQIEGDPDSPISRGRLCPKDSSTLWSRRPPARAKPGTGARTAWSGRTSTWTPFVFTGSAMASGGGLGLLARDQSGPPAGWRSLAPPSS